MHRRQDPPSGWDMENKHLVGMPRSLQEHPRLQQSGSLDRLCKRCADIPWADLIEDPYHAEDGHFRVPIEGTGGDLISSACRMCRLLGLLSPVDKLWYLGCVPAVPGSHFKARLCLFSTQTEVPIVDEELGILDNLEVNIPFLQSSPDFVDLSLVRGWLNDCASPHHKPCQPDDTSKLQGMRVIDCETLLIVPASKCCLYVALSYVWGPPTEFAEEKYVFPILPQQRSRTIEDAIAVTKGLGFRYLWVDRYCIDQNSPEHKMQQISQMGAIYSSAELTIIAAAGNGPKHGLPGVSLPKRMNLSESEVVGSIALVYTTVAPLEHLKNSTWAQRAWTFQEGYLSRRRLFFTDHSLLYVCEQDMRIDIFQEDYLLEAYNSQHILESICPRNSPGLILKNPTTKNENLDRVTIHLGDISDRRLTYASDSLNAFLGVLNQIARKKEDSVYHIWGVVFARIDRNPAYPSSQKRSYRLLLLWYHGNPCNRRAGFPSWSSFAWDAQMGFVNNPEHQIPVPDGLDVRILNLEGSWSLDEYVESGRALQDSGSSDAPAELELVQVTTIPMKIAIMRNFYNTTQCIATMWLIDGICIVSRVWLDEKRQSFEGVFLGIITVREDSSMVILIVERKEDRYERVGLVRFKEGLVDPREWRSWAKYAMWTKAESGEAPELDRYTEEQNADSEALRLRSERPFRFVGEQKQNIILI